MAISNFIPTIWSENLLTALDKQYIAVAHCNRDYEGEIKTKGSVVKICGVGAITVSDYTKDTDMSTPQALSDTVCELEIDQAKYFNFQVDDIDKTQCTPKIMESAMRVAASSIANTADEYIFSLCDNAGATVTCEDTSDGKLLDAIIAARQKLYENNVSDAIEVVLEVSPAVASEIFRAKLALPFCSAEAADAGYLGSFAGCKIYVSNNIVSDENTYSCVMRTTRAIAFAEQLSEIIAYRPEKRFADALKGLHLYGAKVIYPSEMVKLDITVPADATVTE